MLIVVLEPRHGSKPVQQGADNAGSSNQANDDVVVDAEFTEVNDDKK